MNFVLRFDSHSKFVHEPRNKFFLQMTLILICFQLKMHQISNSCLLMPHFVSLTLSIHISDSTLCHPKLLDQLGV